MKLVDGENACACNQGNGDDSDFRRKEVVE